MFNYNIVKELNYSDKQMFDLIIDVEKYPEFLPWCKSTNIYDKDNNIFYSDMEIGFNLIKEKFTSRVTTLSTKRIHSEAISGPFNKMNNTWEIENISHNKCKITLNIEFDFKSFLLRNLMGKLFEVSAIKMIDAFENRANYLYKN
tara:strand:+ start:196 stop:630 length:435 start_codon:yes stop_codon:yes gene_type:complete